MSFPYVEVFLALLVAYMGFSVWSGLDARYPIAAALALLVVTAVVDALGNTATANTLAEYVFFLLGAGVLLLLIDHVRDSRRTRNAVGKSVGGPQREATEAPEEGQGSARHPLDRVKQEAIPVVDAAGHENEDDK